MPITTFYGAHRAFQIKFHPYNFEDNKPILEFAKEHGIVLEAYSSLTCLLCLLVLRSLLI